MANSIFKIEVYWYDLDESSTTISCSCNTAGTDMHEGVYHVSVAEITEWLNKTGRYIMSDGDNRLELLTDYLNEKQGRTKIFNEKVDAAVELNCVISKAIAKKTEQAFAAIDSATTLRDLADANFRYYEIIRSHPSLNDKAIEKHHQLSQPKAEAA